MAVSQPSSTKHQVQTARHVRNVSLKDLRFNCISLPSSMRSIRSATRMIVIAIGRLWNGWLGCRVVSDRCRVRQITSSDMRLRRLSMLWTGIRLRYVKRLPSTSRGTVDKWGGKVWTRADEYSRLKDSTLSSSRGWSSRSRSRRPQLELMQLRLELMVIVMVLGS